MKVKSQDAQVSPSGRSEERSEKRRASGKGRTYEDRDKKGSRSLGR